MLLSSRFTSVPRSPMVVPDRPPRPSDSPAGSDWAELTDDCLFKILSRLTSKELWTGPRCVCKSWRHACTDSSLHSTFDIEAHFESSPDSTSWWSPDFERGVDFTLQSVVDWSDGALTVIRVRHCSDRALNLVAQRCLNLQVLSIKSCQNVTYASMADIATHCTNLRELDISYCHKVSMDSLVQIGSNCPNLKVLKRNLMNRFEPSDSVPEEYLDVCPQDGDSEATAIGKYMPRLEHLEMCFSMLTAIGLTCIYDGCPELVHLDLSGCENLTSHVLSKATFKLKNLKEIIKPILWEVNAHRRRIVR